MPIESVQPTASVLNDVGYVGYVGEKIKNGWQFWVDWVWGSIEANVKMN